MMCIKAVGDLLLVILIDYIYQVIYLIMCKIYLHYISKKIQFKCYNFFQLF
jgi:hypothetical protein